MGALAALLSWQVSQKEREHEQEAKLKDIATIIANMCINTSV